MSELDRSTPTGHALPNGPTRKNGTAFGVMEPVDLGIDGLIPPQVESMAEAPAEAMDCFGRVLPAAIGNIIGALLVAPPFCIASNRVRNTQPIDNRKSS